jgi:hypothetical protein
MKIDPFLDTFPDRYDRSGECGEFSGLEVSDGEPQM